ncbi:MAG TPA: septum formation initiator family protein [Propionicimonas sp.]|nr:septum formation initiator family protein [Propionicimonas sp.]
MARGTRSPHATSTGPGRRTRPRAGTRAPASSGVPEPAATVPTADGPGLGARLLHRGRGITRRALVLVVVVVLLGLSYVSSLRIFVAQQHDLAVADQQIAERSAEIARLESELARWDDPAYVKAQARDRLGWVLPGETGYRVIGEDGKPLGGGVTITAEQELPTGEHQPVWWDRLWGSVQTADAPKRKVGTP